MQESPAEYPMELVTCSACPPHWPPQQGRAGFSLFLDSCVADSVSCVPSLYLEWRLGCPHAPPGVTVTAGDAAPTHLSKIRRCSVSVSSIICDPSRLESKRQVLKRKVNREEHHVTFNKNGNILQSRMQKGSGN